MKRIFLIVLDSFGIGQMPDAAAYGDAGANTLGSVAASASFHMPNMGKLGLFHIDGVSATLPETETKENAVCCENADRVQGAYARLAESSKGKDTTIGHWEIAGLLCRSPMPTYPDGFPKELLDEFSKRVVVIMVLEKYKKNQKAKIRQLDIGKSQVFVQSIRCPHIRKVSRRK